MKQKQQYLQENPDLLSQVLQIPNIHVPGGGGGGVLPGKHLSLGFEIKALTGSKTFVTLMNRYGHCASSETIRRIYTSLEATINDKETLCLMELENYSSSREPTTNDKENVVPDGIRKLPYL